MQAYSLKLLRNWYNCLRRSCKSCDALSGIFECYEGKFEMGVEMKYISNDDENMIRMARDRYHSASEFAIAGLEMPGQILSRFLRQTFHFLDFIYMFHHVKYPLSSCFLIFYEKQK